MCRNIKNLYNFEPVATKEEIENAALQFVRKISGMQKPSEVNEKVFNQTVEKISKEIHELLHSLETKAEPKNREEEARKARERNEKRFGKP